MCDSLKLCICRENITLSRCSSLLFLCTRRTTYRTGAEQKHLPEKEMNRFVSLSNEWKPVVKSGTLSQNQTFPFQLSNLGGSLAGSLHGCQPPPYTKEPLCEKGWVDSRYSKHKDAYWMRCGFRYNKVQQICVFLFAVPCCYILPVMYGTVKGKKLESKWLES